MEDLTITISGDLRSGKTTVANILFNELKRLGVNIQVFDGPVNHDALKLDMTKFDPSRQHINLVVNNGEADGATK